MLERHYAVGARLQWSQPEACRRFYQLMENDRLVGSLRLEKISIAKAEYGTQRWLFQRKGFWSPKVFVTEDVSGAAVAAFAPKWNGGEVAFGSGSRLMLKSSSLLGHKWEFETESGQPVVTLEGPRGLIKKHGEVVVGVDGLPETPLLILLMWYVCLLRQEDDAAVTAVTVAATT